MSAKRGGISQGTAYRRGTGCHGVQLGQLAPWPTYIPTGRKDRRSCDSTSFCRDTVHSRVGWRCARSYNRKIKRSWVRALRPEKPGKVFRVFYVEHLQLARAPRTRSSLAPPGRRRLRSTSIMLAAGRTQGGKVRGRTLGLDEGDVTVCSLGNWHCGLYIYLLVARIANLAIRYPFVGT